MSDFVPLSVRNGSRWKKLRWRYLGWREMLAYLLAPWVQEAVRALESRGIECASVYVVEAFGGSDWYIVAVYASREDAQQMAASVHRGHVTEWVPQGAVGPEG